jgi:hypothetical protein
MKVIDRRLRERNGLFSREKAGTQFWITTTTGRQDSASTKSTRRKCLSYFNLIWAGASSRPNVAKMTHFSIWNFCLP